MPLVERRSGGWVVFVGVLLSVVFIATPADAAKNGAKCKIVGATEITKQVIYTCRKSGKTLKWVKTKAEQVVQGANEITFRPSSSLLLSTQMYPLSGTSTSGLPLTYQSLTPDICSVSGVNLIPIKLGVCTVRASQSGSNLYKPAQVVKVSIAISDSRFTSDQVDTVTGFQIKPIYVVPADGVDNSYDTNGYIAGILDEGNKYLREQLGLQIPIDKHALGYDIQYLKSKLTTAYLKSTDGQADELLAESMALENPGSNRKSYMFFTDVDDLKNGAACGWAYIPGISAVVAIGSGVDASGGGCTGKSRNFADYATSTWVHELTHNFGVDHTLDNPCDLMGGVETSGTCPSNQNFTFDTERTRYIGSALQGEDILKLRVWEGYTDRQDFNAYCTLDPIKRADGFNFAYCPTGTQTIGALEYCWGSINTVTLEEFVDGQWKSLGSGSHFSDPWGPNVIWKCNDAGYTAPWKQLTVTTPNTIRYRWMVNGKESEQFKVIWVR